MQLWLLNHAACEPVDFCFPCLTSMSQILIIGISLRPDGGSVSAKGFLPQAGTANKEFLKNCPIITKQFLFCHNNVKLPSALALASEEAACVTWKKPLTHLSWESVFSELLSFEVFLITHVRPGNAWDFSCGGAALLCSSAFYYHIPLWPPSSSFLWMWAPTKWLQPVRECFILPSPCLCGWWGSCWALA